MQNSIDKQHCNSHRTIIITFTIIIILIHTVIISITTVISMLLQFTTGALLQFTTIVITIHNRYYNIRQV